jgi:hypothetical protein
LRAGGRTGRLGSGFTGGDVGAMEDGIAARLQPTEGGFFND